MGRREEKKRRKRERIESEGLALFLEHGYDRASIEQITQACDIARGTFYLYYSDKLDLFETLVDRWFDPVLDALREVHEQLSEATSPEESMQIYQQVGLALAVLGIQHRDVVLMTFRETRHAGEAGSRVRAREVQLREAVVELTELAAERGLIHTEHPRLVSLLILGAVEKLYYEFLEGTDLGDPEELATQAVPLLSKLLDLEA